VADFFDNWTKQVRKGLLEYCILGALRGEEMYGYALVKAIASVRGLEVAEGTIYPLLARLKTQKLVSTRLQESPEGPARKYYSLTNEGEKQLDRMSYYYAALTTGVSEINGG